MVFNLQISLITSSVKFINFKNSMQYFGSEEILNYFFFIFFIAVFKELTIGEIILLLFYEQL